METGSTGGQKERVDCTSEESPYVTSSAAGSESSRGEMVVESRRSRDSDALYRPRVEGDVT